MPYHVVKHGDQWCVEKRDSSKSFGCHGTKAEADAQMAALYANEPKASMRHLHLVGATGEIRTAQYDGRDHLVVPVVAMVEGVVWAVNSDVPEFVPAEELAETPQQWNGRGCFAGHPKDGDDQVTANTPRTLETSFGVVFDASSSERILKTRRLEMQAWLDPRKAEQVGPEAVDVIRRLRANERVEVSVGCYVEAEQKDGNYNGKDYHSVWRSIVSDHLAFLEEGQEGACSIEAGCGAPRTAVRHLVTAEGIRQAADEMVRVKLGTALVEAAKQIPESGAGFQRVDVTFLDGQTLADVKVFNAEEIELPRSYAVTPITAITLHAAAAREGSMPAGSNPTPKSPQTPGPHPSQPTGPQPSPTSTPKRSLKERFMSLLPLLREGAAEPGVSDQELRTELNDELRKIEPGFMGVYAVYPADNIVIYETCPGDEWKTFRRSYTMSNGKVTLGDTAEEVEAVVTYEPVIKGAGGQNVGGQNNQPVAAAAKPATPRAAACGCNGESTMDKTKKAELIAALVTDPHSGYKEGDEAFLETVPDVRLEEFQTATASRKAEADAKVKLENEHRAAQARLKVAEDKLKIAEQPRTKEQVLADVALVPELKTLLDNQAAAEAEERESLIKTLKSVGANTEEELKAMNIDQLKTLAKYAKVQQPDFSGRGMPVPRSAGGVDEFAPPDPYKAGLAAMAATK